MKEADLICKFLTIPNFVLKFYELNQLQCFEENDLHLYFKILLKILWEKVTHIAELTT